MQLSNRCLIQATAQIDLYRDDGLSVFKNKSGTQLERIKRTYKKHSRTLV